MTAITEQRLAEIERIKWQISVLAGAKLNTTESLLLIIARLLLILTSKDPS